MNYSFINHKVKDSFIVCNKWFSLFYHFFKSINLI